MVKRSYDIVSSFYEFKISISPHFINEKFSNMQNDINIVMVVTFFGGVIAGMAGIGGGMIITPLLLSYGVNPKVN